MSWKAVDFPAVLAVSHQRCVTYGVGIEGCLFNQAGGKEKSRNVLERISSAIREKEPAVSHAFACRGTKIIPIAPIGGFATGIVSAFCDPEPGS